jgi:hypothetical protein
MNNPQFDDEGVAKINGWAVAALCCSVSWFCAVAVVIQMARVRRQGGILGDWMEIQQLAMALFLIVVPAVGLAFSRIARRRAEKYVHLRGSFLAPVGFGLSLLQLFLSLLLGLGFFLA